MNFDAVRGKMAEQRKTQKALADALGMTPQSLCRKLNGKRQFTVSEASRLCTALNIPYKERAKIFLP